MRTEQRPYDRRGRPLAVFAAKLMQRIARKTIARCHPVQEAVNQSCAIKNYVRGPSLDPFLQPRAHGLCGERLADALLNGEALKVSQDAAVDDGTPRMTKFQRLDEAADVLLILNWQGLHVAPPVGIS